MGRGNFVFLLLCCLLSVAVAPLAAAVEPLDPTLSPFWQAARNPGYRRARALIRQARTQLYLALGDSSRFGSAGARKRVALDNALARLERARRLSPGDPEALLLQGRALTHWEETQPGGNVHRRDAEAIETYQALRALDPGYAAYEVAFELAILFTRAEAFELAQREYLRAQEVQLDDAESSPVLSNLAEVTMMAGDLPEAVRLYRGAIDEGAGQGRLLAMWGLAVALDRLGEPAEAQAVAGQAMQEDQTPMAALQSSSVFFVPRYEVHYYAGLGHLTEAGTSLGRQLLRCEQPMDAADALRGATREALRTLLELCDRLKELHPEGTAYAPLRERAARLLEQRDAVTRRTGEATIRQSAKPSLAFEQALTALVDFRRYLDQGGDAGPFAAAAQAHVANVSACLGF